MKTILPIFSFLLALIPLVMLNGPALPARAAPVIHVNTEPGGDIDVIPAGGSADGIYENVVGALFWTGSMWVTDSTSAHTYFTDPITGQRLKNYTLLATLDGSGSAGVVFNQWGYTVTQGTYTYTVSAADHSKYYHYQGVEYTITTILPREKYILRSRGTGNGTSQGYFDIYIQEDFLYTVAFRGDPFWYSYENTTAEQAVQITSTTQGLSGVLPTSAPTERAQYWLDINGGSDLGGMSIYFRTAQISPVRTSNLGSSFPTEFRIKFMDSTPGNPQLDEFKILPRIVNETIIPSINLYLLLIRR